jgi:quinol monooxygenase YgiN
MVLPTKPGLEGRMGVTRSVIQFTIKPGQRDGFLDFFVRSGVLETSSFQHGYLRAQLLSSTSDPNAAVVIADWESPEAYQGWLDNPERERVGNPLDAFLEPSPEGQSFTLIHEVAPQTPVPEAT